MRFYIICLSVILCAAYTASESRQYYPGVGYISSDARVSRPASARLRAANTYNNVRASRARSARIREYELIEREGRPPSSRRSSSRSSTRSRNLQRSRSARRSEARRRYRLARQEAADDQTPVQSNSQGSPTKAFGGIFPSFPGGHGGVTGGGFAQTNGPGAAFAAGFAQSSGKQSFAGGFGAVINSPKFPKFPKRSDNKDDANDDGDDDDDVKTKDSDESGFEDQVTEESERLFNSTRTYLLSSTVMKNRNWTDFADIAANWTLSTNRILLEPFMELKKCPKCKKTLVFLMTNGKENMIGTMGNSEAAMKSDSSVTMKSTN